MLGRYPAAANLNPMEMIAVRLEQRGQHSSPPLECLTRKRRDTHQAAASTNRSLQLPEFILERRGIPRADVSHTLPPGDAKPQAEDRPPAALLATDKTLPRQRGEFFNSESEIIQQRKRPKRQRFRDWLDRDQC